MFGRLSKDMGIDLGTNTLVYVKGRIILQEPSVVTINAKPMMFWQWAKAKQMVGLRQYRHSTDERRVIADFDVTEKCFILH